MSASEDRERLAAGRRLSKEQQIEVATDMRGKGYSNAKIANVLNISESSVRTMLDSQETPEITEDQTIWFPGIYNGRQGVYAQDLMATPIDQVIELVQQRAKEDGEWAIANGKVGDNEDAMREMIAWVSNETNIRQCVDHHVTQGLTSEITVDYICRDLANGSKYRHGTSGN